MNSVFINGELVAKEKATVSITDRGLLFADSIYEVIPFLKGQAIEPIAHLERLNQSLNAITINNPYNNKHWQNIFNTLITANQLQDQDFAIYIQITRGDSGYRQHAIPKHPLKPTVIAFCKPLIDMPARSSGYKAILREDTRHHIAHIKSTNLLANILLQKEAEQAGAIEAILHRNNTIIECTSSNVFIVNNSTLITPPLQKGMLSGITRQLVLRLAKSCGIPTYEQVIHTQELLGANEIMITGSTKQLCPIIQVDNTLINQGKTGPCWQRIQNAYQQYTQTEHTALETP